MTLQTATTTSAAVISPAQSKVNIAAAVMGLLGLLAAFGLIPEGYATENVAGTVVAAISGLIIWFRSKTKRVTTLATR